jgi:2TM domain-containing protein
LEVTQITKTMSDFKEKFEEEEMLRKNPDVHYVDAYRRMKRIKGFYVHLAIFVLVNIFLIAINGSERAEDGESFWHWKTFSTAFFWGIGLFGHGLSVFCRDLFFGKNWEEKKIRELMKNNNERKWE